MLAHFLAAPLLIMPAPPAQDGVQELPPIQKSNGDYILNFAQTADGEEGMTLARLVRACEQVTGITFTYTEETATWLNSAQVRLIGTKTVPKDDFYNFFQILMKIGDCVCTEIGAEPISVIEITHLKGRDNQGVRMDALFVEPEDLEQYRNQPAMLITAVVTMPNTDVAQMRSMGQSLLTNQAVQQMLPVPSTNSIVLTGFGSDVVRLASMLKLLDEVAAVELVQPVFENIALEYAAADELVDIVQTLLEASSNVTQPSRRNLQQGATAPLSQTTSEVTIMVDPRTNSLLVMAMPDQLPGIKELIARLDVDVVERERSYHIYNLENVSAETLAETLSGFLEGANELEASRSSGGGQGQRRGSSSGSRSQGEFVVVPDLQTNSLLIAASRTRYQELRALIERLDERQDQVLIETALIELSSRDFLDIGVELGLANIPGMGSVGGFGVTNFGLSTLSDMNSDGIPDTKVPNSANGITAGILDGDDFSLPLLLRLVEEKRNSNVLNVPSVLVSNNGSATVTTIEEQATTEITATGGIGGQTQESFKGYEEAGITMQISPSISASRYLRLGISLEVSSFLGTVQGAIPPPRITRTIDTTVNVPDGDTMVIGGIIVDNRTETESQIPFLGDIPVIGRLFERNSTAQDRTALYFFVTPHIMSDESFGDLADFSYNKKLEAANTIGFDRVRLIDEHFGQSAEEIGLSGFDVPLYTAPQRGETSGAEVDINPMDARDRIQEVREGASEDGGDGA
jgi:general secretion pathway protein D